MIRQEIRRTLTLEAGGTLPQAHIVFHTSPARAGKVIWICHALTANSDPEDWWPEMVGPGKAIDTEKNRVVCVNMLGSAYGSESPAQENPATGKPWLLALWHRGSQDSLLRMKRTGRQGRNIPEQNRH